MAKHVYIVDLGELHGQRLEKLVAHYSFYDAETFASYLLRYGIDQVIRELEDEAAWEEAEKRSVPGHDLDDGIPF